MDCIQESAARTLLRIEVLLLQGIAVSAYSFAVGLLAIPILPIANPVLKIMYNGYLTKPVRWWAMPVYLPVWILQGLWDGILYPFKAFINAATATIAICKAEWRERWRNGTLKNPDGTAMVIPDDEDEELVEAAITKSVLDDYNDEARQHGQGIG